MLQISELNGEKYDDSDCVFFRNPTQAAHYLFWGAKLVDLFVGGDMKIVYVFLKKTHNKLKYRWIKTFDNIKQTGVIND